MVGISRHHDALFCREPFHEMNQASIMLVLDSLPELYFDRKDHTARVFDNKIHFHYRRLSITQNFMVAVKVNLQIMSVENGLCKGLDKWPDVIR